MISSLFLAPHWRRVLMATVVGVVSACGGGTSQIEPFVAGRLIAFGDELSVLTPAGPQPEFEPGGEPGSDGVSGRKYGVNALTTENAVDCAAEPIWVQALANHYGMVFAECNPGAVAEPRGRMLAQVGAQAADLAAQIDALVAAGGVVDKDLATVLIGANDVVSLYKQFPARSEAELIAEIKTRGDGAAVQINRLIDLGARVIFSTVPDMGLSPYGLAEKEAHTDTDRSALLSRLTSAYNVRVRVGILNDGRFIGLVLADEMVQAMALVPTAFGLVDAKTAICTVALPDCNANTLIADARSSSRLWADGRRMAYGGHTRLGALAVARANGNPF